MLVIVIGGSHDSLASSLKPKMRAVNLICGMSGKHFSEGIITGQWQCPAETLGEPDCLGEVEPAEDAMAKQATGAQQGRINFGGGAVDRADDLEAKEIGEHTIGEVQDRADLFAIVGAASHQSRIRILQDHNKVPVGMAPALVSPEADKFGL